MTDLTVLSLAEMIRDGSVTVAAAETDLTVEALADTSGSDCYPATEIEFRRGDEVIASVGCWMLGCYLRGPNRRDTGEHIGDGWQWQTDDGDGQSSGKPYSSISRDGAIVTWGSGTSMSPLTLPVCSESDALDDDGDAIGRDDAIETIDAAINDAYDEISVSAADDDDVYAAMIAQSPDRDLDVEIGDETISVVLYAANDAGRKVYTHDGADEVWEDADDCVTSARKHLASLLTTAAEALAGGDNDLAASLASCLEDA